MGAQIKTKNQDMTTGSIAKSIIMFSVPLLIGNVFQQLYNTADSVIAGNFIGKEALAAIGSSTSLINLIIGLFIGIAAGAGVVISQYFGAKNEEKMQWAVHTSITLSMIGGAALTVIGIVLSPQILRWMGTPGEIMASSVLYQRIFFCGSIFNITYNMGAGILRGVGDSKRPLYYLCFTSILNVVLDILFILVFGMGIEGPAIATVLSQALSAFLVLRALMKDSDIYTLSIWKLGIDFRMMKRILYMGVPTGLQGTVISFANVVVQSNINAYGADAVAGSSSYMRIDGFALLPIFSFGIAAMTFTGQNIGAGRYDRIKKGTWQTILISSVYCIVMTVLLLITGRQALRIFSRDPAVNEIGYLMLRTLAPFYLSMTVAQVLTNVMRGMGKSVQPMLIMIGCMVGVRMLWVNIMKIFFPSLITVFWGYPISWTAAAIASLIYIWKSDIFKIPSA